jgi:hypothetical protein
MLRVLRVGIAALFAMPGPAAAESASRYDGQYVLTQPRHNLKAKTAGGSAANSRFNPKEFKLDQKADWKKKPKTKTLCAPPGGKPRPC